jgi:CPA1 family monovalent cation:H+ antiporter
VLNGVIFILIGLQLGPLREAVPTGRLGPLAAAGALICVTAIVVRLVWVPLAAWVPRRLSYSLRLRDPMPPWPHLLIIGWTGMRGIVSLAAALALPLTIADGSPFPFRAEITLITFMVILVTLVLQGLTLPLLIRALNLGQDHSLEQEERQAREHAAAAALALLDEVASQDWPVQRHLEELRVHYTCRHSRYADDGPMDTECTVETSEAFKRLRYETLTAERQAVITLRNQGVVSDEILHRLEHELDVEAVRFGLGEIRVSLWQHT